MIMSFANKETERVFELKVSYKLPMEIQRIAWRKMVMINAVSNIRDLSVPPGNHLELLKGDRAGQYSIRINRKWRVCFNWCAGEAYDVEIVDYH